MKSPISMQKVLFIAVLMVTTVLIPAQSSAQAARQEAEQQKRMGFVYIPIIFSTPETGLAGGSAFSLFFRPPEADSDSRPSTITPIFIYTQKKQIMSALNLDLYWKDETYRLVANIGYKKYPDKFYGIGNDLPKDNDEDFTSEGVLLLLDFQRKIRPGLYVGLQYEVGNSRIIEVDEENNPLLYPGDVSGSEGGKISGAGLILNWDTRDNIFSPLTGMWHQLSARFYGGGLGSKFSYSRYNLDLRQYFPVRSSHVLACQAYANIMTSRPPFELMSRLGGPNIMRGYYMGRYSDKCMIAVQAEYRMPVWRRIGMVCFAGLGDVADEIGNFRLGEFKHAFGLGLRFLFSPEEKINLRLDFAQGKGSSGMYISIGEAF